jgi:alpha-D-ribose 1-methylphosphonate 5-triphosphate synthase subunit PhnH
VDAAEATAAISLVCCGGDTVTWLQNTALQTLLISLAVSLQCKSRYAVDDSAAHYTWPYDVYANVRLTSSPSGLQLLQRAIASMHLA